MLKNQDTFVNKLFEKQVFHFLILGILLYGIVMGKNLLPYSEGELWGVSSSVWFWLAVFAAVFHQVYTWLMWRLELYAKFLSKTLGRNAFPVFRAIFSVLGLSRFLIIPLAVSNRDTIFLPWVIQWGLSSLFLLLSIYLFYSVFRYFGLKRAAGLDHFTPDEAKSWDFVNRGIFRYTSNGMYLYGFLILWVPGLMLESSGALLAAGFSHLYIWVHYFCTEKPDLKYIYKV